MNKTFFLLTIATASLAGLLGCGSGGGNTNPVSEEAPINNPPQETIAFTSSATQANIDIVNSSLNSAPYGMSETFAGGVAVADCDNDGDLDLYFVAGDAGANKLMQNQGDGTFVDISIRAGVDLTNVKSSGPVFADLDGDGYVDLFVGAVDATVGEDVYLFQNQQDCTFTDITNSSGIAFTAANTISTSFADYNGDGKLDLFTSHWGYSQISQVSTQLVWRNRSITSQAGTKGTIVFTDVSKELGLDEIYGTDVGIAGEETGTVDRSFAPTLADIDRDGDQDLLLVSDFETSKLLKNIDGTRFELDTNSNLTDEAGMGSAVADYDNDGDMDWFVTSIMAKPEDMTLITTGNRLYENDGNGNFTDNSSFAGVRDGGWGWGACFGDFNNDGLDDIFHVNGWNTGGGGAADYSLDRSRLYLAQGDGSFVDIAANSGVNEITQGRGVSCADLDRDGDIDIVISNNRGIATYYQNQSQNNNNFINIKLKGNSPNTQAIGAIVIVSTDSKTLTKEIRIGNNFSSHNPVEAHFGLGTDNIIKQIEVIWSNDTRTTILTSQNVNQFLTIEQP